MNGKAEQFCISACGCGSAAAGAEQETNSAARGNEQDEEQNASAGNISLPCSEWTRNWGRIPGAKQNDRPSAKRDKPKEEP